MVSQALFFTTGEDFPVDSTLSQGAVIVKDNVRLVDLYMLTLC